MTIGLEDTEIKGTFELASYTCSAGTYLKAGETSCSSCLAGSYCPGGTYPYNLDEDQGINECSNGTYSLGNASSCTLCVEGSTSSEGAEACTACQNGTTTSGDGQTSCNATCPNTSNVSEWNNASWNNDNTMTNLCNIKTCVVGYVLNNNTCAEAIATNTVDGVTTYYLSLQEAIDASATGEAKLLKDNTENVTVDSSINKTINLNGKVLTGTLTNNGTIAMTGNGTITNSAEVIINNATLRIVNGTYTSTTTTDIDGAVKNISGDMIIDNATMDGGATNTIGVNDGTVIIEDITMTSNSTSIAMMSGGTGTLTINGGTITQTTGAAIYATSGNMGKVVINGGTINGGLLILSGTLNITGGRIYVTIQISNATATITGGTIETNGGNGIIIYSGATVRISGGTVKSNISNVPTVKIFSGGSFYMTNGTVRNTATSGSGAFYAVEKLNGGTCSITGGTVSKHNC